MTWGRISAAGGTILGVGALLAAAPGAPATPPGDNGPIVWQSFSGPAYEIWIMDPDGGNPDELTDNSWHDERAQLSPDGSKITFMSFRTPADDSVDIYTMNVDGSNQTNLTNDDTSEYEPTWSPDSAKIAFTRQTSVGQDIWRIDANGANPVNLTNTPIAYECCPEYSPDGSKIVFTNSGHTDGDPKGEYDDNEIWVMNANGSGQTQLTSNTSQDVGPTWSPDGERIAWAVDGVIWTMDADGDNQAPLTGNGSYYAPVWSPDGTRIAAQGSGSEIYSISIANPLSDVVNLTQNAVQDEYASWAPAPGTGEEPETEITKRPNDVITKDRVKYEFEAEPPAGASFECKLDQKPYKGCSSPKRYKNLSKGKHRFKVRATAGGQTDPTPAKDSFKVKP